MDTGGEKKHERAVIVYDGACPLCSAAISWVRQNDSNEAFEMVPCQSDDRAGRFPTIGREVCMQAMQLVLPGGEVLAAEKALPEVLSRLRRYRGLRVLFRLPGFGAASRAMYRWFADHRYGIAHLWAHVRRSPEAGTEHAAGTSSSRRSEQRPEDRTWQRKMS